LFTYALTWSGFESRASVFYGSAFGLLYQLYVEVEDGFHKDYGFSPGDAFSDVIGASIPLAQEAFPVLRNLSLKWSYFPSSEYIDALKQKQSRVFIDDYQGQIYWLGMDPHFLMSDAWAKSIPAWLGISLGAAVRNLDGSGGGTKQFYLALDYNLSKIETDSPFLRGLFIALDHFHLPAPAIYLDGKALKAGVVY
jgi:hypothetical protein